MDRFVKFLLLRFFLTIFSAPWVEPQAVGVDCNDKSFLCVDDERFQICMDLPNGRSKTVDDAVYPCPPDLFCTNDGSFACNSSIRYRAKTQVNTAVPSEASTSEGTESTSTAESSTPELTSTSLNSESSEVSDSSESTEISSSGSTSPSESSTTSSTEKSSTSDNTTYGTTESFSTTQVNTAVPSEASTSESTESTSIAESLTPEFTSTSSTSESSEASDSSESMEISSSGSTIPSKSSTTSSTEEPSTTDNTTSGTTESFSTSEASTTEQITVTEPITITTPQPFVCKASGRYPHETDCHKYYNCLGLPDGLFKMEMTCFYDMVYDPVTQHCVSDQSTCQREEKFTCTAVGKFPDPSDAGKYFWCLRNGQDYQLYMMNCPAGQRFSVDFEQCVGWSSSRRIAKMDSNSDSSDDSDDSNDSDDK